jgi:DNA primase
MTAYEFLIQVALEQNDAKSPEGKRKIMQSVVPVLAEITHAVELEHYTKVLAERLDVSNSSVAKDIANFNKNKQFGGDQKRTEEASISMKARIVTRQQKLEEYVWFLLFHSQPDQFLKRAETLSQIRLLQPGAKKILDTITTHKGDSLEAIQKSLPEDLQDTVFQLYSQPMLLSDTEPLDTDKEWAKTVTELKHESSKQRRAEITAELEKIDAEREKTPQVMKKQEELLRELVGLR